MVGTRLCPSAARLIAVFGLRGELSSERAMMYLNGAGFIGKRNHFPAAVIIRHTPIMKMSVRACQS